MTAAGGAVPGEARVTEAEALSACEAILASEFFVNAPRMGRLLRFLVELAISGDTRNAQEFSIGIAVFDREPSTYSTAEDPTVRVQVGRLRSRLKAYYAARGAPGGVEIGIPLGSYMPLIRRAGPGPERGDDGGCALALQPLRCIAHCAEGAPFAQGLQEELLDQLFRTFGEIVVAPAIFPPLGDDGDFPGSMLIVRNRVNHLIEGSVRIDAERIRTSVRLVDVAWGRVTWSRHFDREMLFAIGRQEELASSICGALKLHLQG